MKKKFPGKKFSTLKAKKQFLAGKGYNFDRNEHGVLGVAIGKGKTIIKAKKISVSDIKRRQHETKEEC